MKPLNSIMLILLFNNAISYSQSREEQQLSIEIGVTRNNFMMSQFNQNIVDYYINEIERLQEQINLGVQKHIGLKLKLPNSLSLGLNVTHSKATTDYLAKVNIFLENEQNLIDWYTLLRTTAFHFNTTLNYNAISLIKDNRITKNMNTSLAFGPEINLGLGIAHYSSFTDVPLLNLHTQNLFKSYGSSFQIGIFTEFNLVNNFFYGIGLRTGYQFFKTNILKLHSGEAIIGFGETPPNLDFSGWYYGVYLKIGK